MSPTDLPGRSTDGALRVRMRYETGSGERREERELPLVIGVVADLRGRRGGDEIPLKDRRFEPVTLDGFDRLMEQYAPRLLIRVPDRLAGTDETLDAALRFRRLGDFDPDWVVARVPRMARLARARALLADAKQRLLGDRAPSAAPAAGGVDEPAAALAALYAEPTGRSAREDEPLQRFVAALGHGAGDPDFLAWLDVAIADIDDRLGAQVDAVLHDPAFQRLEATWRAIHWLVERLSGAPLVRIKLLDLPKDELIEDLEDAPELSKSELYRLIYTSEYGQFGGEPYGSLVLDYELGRGDQDMTLLRRVADVAAASHSPVLAGPGAGLFGWAHATDLSGESRRIADILSETATPRWSALRDQGNSRYLAMVYPRLLGRRPHRVVPGRPAGFAFDEDVTIGPDGAPLATPGAHLWINPAYALAERIGAAFGRHGWCVAITGAEPGNGVIDPPARDDLGTGESGRALRPVTEVLVSETRERELAETGLVPLTQCHASDLAAIFSAHSVQRAPIYRNPGATLNAQLSTRLPYMLAASRVTHFLKVMMRERIGGFHSAVDVEMFLSQWLMSYVAYQDDAAPELKAERPLRDAAITVAEIEESPGLFQASVALQPHFQLDDVDVSLNLTTELQG